MLLITDLLSNVVNKLGNIPEVLADMGDGGADVISYFVEKDPESSLLAEVLKDMPNPGIVVCWDNTELGYRGQITQFRHNFSAWIRTPGGDNSYYQVLQDILNGVSHWADSTSSYPPSGSGLQLLSDEIHPYCDPFEFVAFTRETDEARRRHIFRLAFSLQEKGGRGF